MNKMLEDLARSGLTEKDAKRLGMRYLKELPAPHRGDGYIIPYFTIAGKKTAFYRYRLLTDTRSGFEKISGGKMLKYVQPPKTLNEVYFPPLVDWGKVLSSQVPIIITEGEKKAAAGCRAGLAVIGLGGVWNFQSARAGKALLDGLSTVPWEGRPAYVLFDSDAAANIKVRQAAGRLASRLAEQGALVHVGYLPGDVEKVGLDDYLLKHSVPELQKWLGELPLLDQASALHEMNELVTYVKDPGLVVVNSTGQRISPRAYKDHAYSHFYYTVKIEKQGKPAGTAKFKTATEWLEWPHRAMVQRMVYEPGQPALVDGCMNLWKGYPIKPKKGDVSPWVELTSFLFKDQSEELRWFLRWCAYPFQHPGAKLRTAVLMWGPERGTGKSLVGFTLGDLYGENYVMIGDAELENANFNSWANNRQFVFADEVTGQNNRKLANLLKTMITREQVTVNQKYVPEFTVRDCINYYFTSNDPDAFYIDAGERRYFIHEVKGKPLPTAFYERYDAWRNSEEGKAALLHHLLTLPLGDFNPMAAAPATEAKRQMVEVTRTELEVYVADVAAHPADYLKRYGGGDLTTNVELVAGYDAGDGKRVSGPLMARKAKLAGLEAIRPAGYTVSHVRLSNGQRVIFYALKHVDKWRGATAEDLRTHYEKHRSIK